MPRTRDNNRSRPEDTGAAWRDRVLSRTVGAATDRRHQQVVDISDRLVEAARDLMVERGGASFTVQEAAQRAGVALATVYSYFAGKDELILAVIEEWSRVGRSYLASRLEGVEGAEARLEVLVREQVAVPVVTDPGPFTILLREQIRLAQAHPEAIRAAMAPLLELLESELEAGVASGAFATDHVQRDAAIVYRLIGAYVHELVTGSTLAPEEAARELVEFCVRALVPRSAPRR